MEMGPAPSLLNELFAKIARWSEGDVLNPKYLALHESLFPASPAYRMSEYQRGLLESLPDELQVALSKIKCLYSYQHTAETEQAAHYRCDIIRGGESRWTYCADDPVA